VFSRVFRWSFPVLSVDQLRTPPYTRSLLVTESFYPVNRRSIPSFDLPLSKLNEWNVSLPIVVGRACHHRPQHRFAYQIRRVKWGYTYIGWQETTVKITSDKLISARWSSVHGGRIYRRPILTRHSWNWLCSIVNVFVGLTCTCCRLMESTTNVQFVDYLLSISFNDKH